MLFPQSNRKLTDTI